MFVFDFKPTFSDCHCKISIKILASFEYQKETSGLKDFPTETHVGYNNILTYDHFNYYPFGRDRSKNAESINCFQETFAHPAVQNEIKQFLTDDISFEENGINKATNYIHGVFDKFSLKKKIVKKETKNGLIMILIL